MEGVPCAMLVPWGEAMLPSPSPPPRVPLVWLLPARALLGAGRSSLLLVTTLTQGWAAQMRQEGGTLWASLSTQVSRRHVVVQSCNATVDMVCRLPAPGKSHPFFSFLNPVSFLKRWSSHNVKLTTFK